MNTDYPLFYFESTVAESHTYTLSTDTSKHCTLVLRMKSGDKIWLTDGLGQQALARIVVPDKYKTQVVIESVLHTAPRAHQLVMAIGFTRNKARNEWLLEKVVELGIDGIIPLQCFHSERDKFNVDRAKQVMIAAMLQSQQTRLPQIYETVSPAKAIEIYRAQSDGNVLIAHCIPSIKNTLWQVMPTGNALIMIGPEGDFSQEEIDVCIGQGAIPVTLGANRLRTETAAMYACTIYNQKNYAD